MEILKLQVGALSTNCYIIKSNRNNGVIIDPGADFNDIMAVLKSHSINLKYIVLTHGHFDHVGAVVQLKNATNAKVYLHRLDVELTKNPSLSLSTFADDYSKFDPFSPDVILEDGYRFSLDELIFHTIHTPGHTKGSCVITLEDVMFSGDTLFKGSVGRTDLFGGSQSEMSMSAKKLAKIRKDYVVLPGHGEQTQLGIERNTNPYMGTNYDYIFWWRWHKTI